MVLCTVLLLVSQRYVSNFTFLFILKANGLDERFNQTLQSMLGKVTASKKEAWSSYLDTCVFAYNTSWHESSKFSPFELMFGRRATLPIDIDVRKAGPEQILSKYVDADEPEHFTRLQEERQKRLEEAKANILAAQEKQKEYFDKKHACPECYKVSVLVLKKDFLRKKRKGGKLDHRYVGPYKILKVLPKGVYLLQLLCKLGRGGEGDWCPPEAIQVC